MRLRLPELLTQAGMTAYGVARQSGGRIDPSTLYRLVRKQGRVRYFDAELCEALLDVLDVEPGELFQREPPVPSKAKRARR